MKWLTFWGILAFGIVDVLLPVTVILLGCGLLLGWWHL